MSVSITCMIVDDEPLARGVIRTLLAGYPNWQIVSECSTALDAWQELTQRQVQVMFLDIQMPGVTGTDFLRTLKNPPLTIFTTAYSNYAVEGFELNALDYLLKPITAARFEQTIQKAERALIGSDALPESTCPQESNALSSNHIFIKSEHRQVKVLYADILFLEAQRDVTKLYLTTGHTILANFHLKILEEMLPASKFLRVHRSYVIAVTKVTAIAGNMLDVKGYQVPIGASFKLALMKALHL